MSKQSRLIQKSLLIGGSLVLVVAVSVSLGVFNENTSQETFSESISSGLGAIPAPEFHGELERKGAADAGSPVLAYKSKLGLLPDSLQGTLMQQSLLVDEQGDLRISSDIRRVFDFFLSAIDEEELELILARIDEYLDHYLNEPALSQSKQVLAQYISLKQALFDFEQERSGSLKGMIDSGELAADKTRYLALLQEQLQTKSDLRAEHLDPEVYEAFYADEEAFDQYSLARILVESDASLSVEEKSFRLAQVDAEAPRELVESRQETQITDVLKERVSQIREEGGGQEEVKALRVEMFGTEAAERFEALDQQRAEWKTRLDSYLAQRKEILALEGLSGDEQQVQVDTLRSAQFDELEQIRVRVYEKRSDV